VRFLIFGAGALGSFVGGILAQHHDVVLVGRGDHMNAVRRQGLRITGRTELKVRPHTSTVVPEGEALDVVIITTKAYDTAAAVEALNPFHDSALFVSMQNGLGNAEEIARRAVRVAAAVTNQGVTFVGPGHVHHAGEGPTLLGSVKGVTGGGLQPLARALSGVGVAAEVVPDIMAEIWAKAVINAAINPITALVGAPNGIILRRADLREVASRVVAEATAVARAVGFPLGEGDMVERLVAVVKGTADNRSRMLQDVERGRRTEIGAINGAIVEEAHRRGLGVPLTEGLLALVLARTEGAPP
jgi:2-dehydropantoate 2-reductase